MINKFQGTTRWLSNFHIGIIDMPDGIAYPSGEHAYQAHKSTDSRERRRIAALLKPRDARRAGQELKLREDWEDVKLDIMAEITRRKFNQDSELGAKLLETSNQKLIEGNTWGDQFWGVCNGKGENHLGHILMQIRDELRTIEVRKAGQDLYDFLCKYMPDSYRQIDSRMVAWRKATEQG